jgi:hypothetical protein
LRRLPDSGCTWAGSARRLEIWSTWILIQNIFATIAFCEQAWNRSFLQILYSAFLGCVEKVFVPVAKVQINGLRRSHLQMGGAVMNHGSMSVLRSPMILEAIS